VDWKKRKKTKKPDLRDGLPGRESGGVSNAEFVGDDASAPGGEGPDIVKPGISKHPAGQTTQG
jgi:hypothetical protein